MPVAADFPPPLVVPLGSAAAALAPNSRAVAFRTARTASDPSILRIFGYLPNILRPKR
jgi:hypothetical protein